MMLEQQFLTTFNKFFHDPAQQNPNNTKKQSLIVDFINGMYQGYLSPVNNLPDGLGIVIDDQFNFIICSNWLNAKIDGYTYIKLANQIVLWGLWEKGVPKTGRCVCVKIGVYTMYVPSFGNNNQKLRRVRRCIIIHEGKNKLYTVAIQKYPQGTQTKRQYSIIVQKVHTLSSSTYSQQSILQQVHTQLQILLYPYEYTQQQFLLYMQQNLKIIKIFNKHNGIFITGHYSQHVNRRGIKLGLLLEKKKLMTKSVGQFSRRFRINGNYFNSNQVDGMKNNMDQEDQIYESIAVNHYHNNNKQRSQNLDQNCEILLNGLGLSKLDNQPIIGAFKDDLLIRQFNAEQNIESIRKNTNNYARNINGSVVKQILGHEHMRSMSYQHNYLYFPQIKKVVGLAVQMHKYIQMFQRLSHQKQSVDSYNESISHHQIQKYQNNFNFEDIKKSQANIGSIGQTNSSSSGSIIDLYPQFRVNVNLNKEIYRDSSSDNKNRKQQNWTNNSRQKNINKHIIIQQSEIDQNEKKPGFIRKTRPSAHFPQQPEIQKQQPISPQKYKKTRTSPAKTNKAFQTKWKL